jgi:quinol monooxygenase YgiN
MSEPIVFISRFQIKEGKLNGLKQLSSEAAKLLQAEKPRTLVFLPYLNENGTQITIVHVFADADSMDLHVQGADERSRKAYEYIDPKGWEIYGRPSEPVLQMMQKAAASAGVTLVVHPDHLSGFLRLTPGP